MASYLHDTVSSIRLDVVTSSLEDAELAPGHFDLAVGATSFHWVDQELGLSKLRNGLTSGGWVALRWTVFAIPISQTGSARPWRTSSGPATRGVFDEPGRPPFQLDESHRRRDLTRWAGLNDVKSEIITWTCVLTPVQARALYATMATVIRRSPEEQLRILDEVERITTELPGGIVRRRFVTAIYTGRRD